MEENTQKYSKENFKKFFITAWWAYKEIFKLAPWDTVLLIIVILLTAAIPALVALINSKILDQIVNIIINHKEWTLKQIIDLNQPYFRYVLYAAGLTFIAALLRRATRYIRNKFRIVHLKTQENKLYIKISSLDISRFEDSKMSDEILKARDNLWKVRDFVDTSIDLLLEFIGAVVSGAIIFNFSPILGVFLLITAVPSATVTLRFIKKWYEFYDNNIQSFRKRGWVQSNITNEDRVKQNRVNKADSVLTKMLHQITNFIAPKELKVRTDEFRQASFVSIFDQLSDMVVPIVILLQVLSGSLTLGQYSFFTGRAFDFSGRFDNIIGDISAIFDNALGMAHVKHLFDTNNNINSGATKLNLSEVPTIEFKNVYFKYPGSEKYALRDINLVVNPKDEIAIVGENGAGKTTLIKLMLRLYDTTSGLILVNGKNINELDLQSYYKVVSTLFQDYGNYGMLTVSENISIGAPQRFSITEVKNAAKFAEADKFIEGLKNKYDTVLSKQFKDGTNLSTGQSQKIALARMFYRNSPVLIFDEPTASIDPTSEYHIFKRIYEFMRDKTVIIISHKFSTVRNAQKVYVMDKGKIVESGSHRELMQLNGKYANAFNKQAEGYLRES
ncbi:ABC transporter ATP-binding protein/permease [Candidatus Dojkabacteria bacterium]|jgi:ABC-type multidrug transport system fused ATPase/permease subunit|nr:ABC transporter ATP-binding protein/permease [Candidatus Dojkabacteria bacterium]